jgi:hypothetical protein
VVTGAATNLTATSSPALLAVGDPEGTRTIMAIVVLLVVIGIGLIMVAVWFFKITRPDDELLAPLEVMGERKWRRADPVWQRRRLDELRPEGAQPLQPSAAPPVLDEAFDAGPAVSGFDDLHDRPEPPAHQPEDADATGEPAVAHESQDDSDATAATDASQSSPTVPAPSAPSSLSAASNGGGDRGAPSQAAPTPIAMQRPGLDDLPDHELDPEVLAAAMAELDAELRRDPERDDT